MTEQLNVQQMAQRLMTADNILILCHKNPDGDTIGCGSALYCALKALDKTWQYFAPMPFPTGMRLPTHICSKVSLSRRRW